MLSFYVLFSLYLLYACCFTSVVSLPPTINHNYTYELCLVGHTNAEPFLLAQWIAYHRYLGISKFFMADDCSKDTSVSAILQLYAHLGFVEEFGPENSTSFHVVDVCNKPNRQPNEAYIIDTLVQYSKQFCQFIVVMDQDEYIANYLETNPRVHALSHHLMNMTQLNSSFYGIRLPTITMDCRGHIQRPKGLVIENSFQGVPWRLLKTIAKVGTFSMWKSPHFPRFHDTLAKYRHPFVYPEEITPYHGCNVTKSPWYIRHYFLRSWEEYSHFRAARQYDAAGLKSIYPNNYAYWERTSKHFQHRPCANISKEFILNMAIKVKHIFRHDAYHLALAYKNKNIHIIKLLTQLNITIHNISHERLVENIYQYFYDPPINWNP